jgi:hypothetical protein
MLLRGPVETKIKPAMGKNNLEIKFVAKIHIHHQI